MDQKEHSLGEGPAHAGEYEGKLVEEEMERIKRWGVYVKQQATTPKTSSCYEDTDRDW